MADKRSIQRTPFGLLQALGMKGTGEYPSNLSEEVQSTFDLRDLYGLQNLTITSTEETDTWAENDDAVQRIVPEGELWRVHAVSAILTRDAADIAQSAELLATWRDSAGGAYLAFQRLSFGATYTGYLEQSVGLFLPEPLWMRPGQRIQIRTNRFPFAQPSTISIRVLRAVFPN